MVLRLGIDRNPVTPMAKNHKQQTDAANLPKIDAMRNTNLIAKVTRPSKPLLRFLANDRYCADFVNEGKLRLGSIADYAKMGTDLRGDSTEAVAQHTNVFGGSQTSRTFNEAVFILCCSRACLSNDVKELAQKFNPHGALYLEIFDPQLLVKKIRQTALAQIHQCIALYPEQVYWVDVEYTKGDLQHLANQTYSNTHIFQKPKTQLSPQVVSTVNGAVMNRHMHMVGNSLFAAHWPIGTDPANYEEEQECRLVLDATYRLAPNTFEFLPENEKPKFIDLTGGDLSDCVRIRDMRGLQKQRDNFEYNTGDDFAKTLLKNAPIRAAHTADVTRIGASQLYAYSVSARRW